MLLLLLACQPTPVKDTPPLTVDSGDSSPGESTSPLDRCAAAGQALTLLDSAELNPLTSVDRLLWQDGLLAVVLGSDEIALYDAPFDGAAPTLRSTILRYEAWEDMTFLRDGRLAASGSWSVGVWDPAGGDGVQLGGWGNNGPLWSIAATEDGFRVSSADTSALMEPVGGEPVFVAQSFDEVHLVATEGAHSWLAGVKDGQGGLAFDLRGGYSIPAPGLSGAPTGLQVFADSVTLVSSDEVARYDRVGTLVGTASTGDLHPGGLRASPGSRYAWTVAAGQGAVVIDDLELSLLAPSSDMLDLAVIDDWLLSGHADGTVRRWGCSL